MQLRRFLKSLINNFLFIVNVILWLFNIKSVGELVTGINVGKDHKEKLMYGLCSFVQYLTYGLFGIGFILTIYWCIKNDLSIAERLSGLKQT